MLHFSHRFHGRGGIRYVNRNGHAIRSRLVTVKFTVTPQRRHSRVAVVVSKKVLKSAVGRNRIRRRVYEYVRNRLAELPRGTDLVLIVGSAELRTMPPDELKEQLDQVLEPVILNKPLEN